MKRAPLQLVLAILLTLALSVGAAAQTTIEYWFGETPEAYIQAMSDIIARFEAENPDIKVNMILKGGPGTYSQEFLTSILGGQPPDVAYLNSFDIFEWSLTDGMIQPLNSLLPAQTIAEFDRSFLPGPTTDMRRNGIWYGVPLRTDTRGIYMNVDLFEQAALDPHRGPETIDELDQFAARLTRWGADGNVEILGFAPAGNNWADELPWIWAFGGEFFNYESTELTFTGNDRNLDTVNWILSYADRYGANAASTQANFLNQRAAMHINSTTRLAAYPESNPELNWWTSAVPSVPGVERMSLGASLGPAIPYGARNVEAATRFVAYFARQDVQVEWYEKTQAQPTRLDAVRAIIPLIDDPRERNLVELLPITRVVPPLYSQLRVVWRNNLNAMRAKTMTPQAVLETTQREMAAIYREAFSGAR